MRKIAALVILKCNDKLLLLKRFKEPFKGYYVPVGGKLEPNETPLEAAVRETFEETGIRPDTFIYMGTLFEVSPVDYNWLTFVYLAEIPYQTAPQCDEGILKWIHKDDLNNILTPETDLHIYQKIFLRQPFAYSARYNADLTLLKLTNELNF